MFFFFKQKTAYEMRISDWSSDVCSSDLADVVVGHDAAEGLADPLDFVHRSHSAATFRSSVGTPSSTIMPKRSGHFSRTQPRIPCWKHTTLMMMIAPSAPHSQPSRSVKVTPFPQWNMQAPMTGTHSVPLPPSNHTPPQK